LALLQNKLPVAAEEAYATFNMGAGFALYVAAPDTTRALAVAQSAGFALLHAGIVEPGPRRVILEPLDVTYAGASLQLR
jgi:phosphoribosylformylglycinamidine cyclo-ligase